MRPLHSETAKIFSPLKLRESDTVYLTADESGKKFAAEIYSRVRGVTPLGHRIKDQASSAARVELIGRLPEKKELTTYGGGVTYEIPATDICCGLLAALVTGPDSLQFHDLQTEAIFRATLGLSEIADLCAEWNATYKEKKLIPDCGLIFPDDAGDTANALYQKLGAAMGFYSDGFLYAMEQGTGKTPTTIAVICNLAKHIWETENRMARVITVCPNNVRANWESEMQKFCTVPGKVTVMRGNEVGRVRQLIDAMTPEDDCWFSQVVCGYETVTKSWEALGMVEWDLAIADEAHYFKSTKTKRYETMMKLRDKSWKRLALTGTPIANSALDIYAILEFLGEGQSGFSSYKAFCKFYGVWESGQFGDKLVALQNLPFMRERLARKSFIIKKEEALPDLPAKVYDLVEIEMTHDQQDYYNEVANNLAVEIEKDLSNDGMPRSMIVSCILTKLLRLTQITSGFMSWQPEFDFTGQQVIDKRLEYFNPNPKIDALREIIRGKSFTDKTSIWSCFNASIDAIEWMFQDEGMERGIDYVVYQGKTGEEERLDAVHRFNNEDQCRFWIANGAAGATGLNLLGYPPGRPEASACNHNHCIIYDQNWSMLIRSQLEDRGHRRGTRTQFRVTDLMVPRTLDADIRERVLKKQINAIDITNIRQLLQNVFKPVSEYL